MYCNILAAKVTSKYVTIFIDGDININIQTTLNIFTTSTGLYAHFTSKTAHLQKKSA